ncbi:PREDICTED: interferon-induced protein 44-like [Branchiostoma belcheri]|uniref:Interferon-induced protein 44-like n=1 Tax=Branchiostoma belcheri TaxID=7741 RepID=A0A6P5A3E0_BRABE|nr:PREDICTED: interferon-induced protein 44-like [Branchiostoma belcheri]
MAGSEVENARRFLKFYQTGQIVKNFPDARRGEMGQIIARVGLFGLTGSGKSSFINTVSRCIEGKDMDLAMVQSSGAEGTVILEEFGFGGEGTNKPGFKLTDTRGFGVLGEDANKEMLAILNGDIRDGQFIDRGEMREMAGHDYRLSREIHVVLWFLKGSDPRLKSGAYQSHMEFLRMQLFKRAMKTLTIITHDDELQRKGCTEQKRQNIAELARQITGSDPDQTYFLTNYMKGKPFATENIQQVLDIVKTALRAAEYTIRMRQSKRELHERVENLAL